VFAEAVSTGTDGTKSVNYSALIAPLIEAVKEQQKEIQDLKARAASIATPATATNSKGRLLSCATKQRPPIT